MYIQYKNFCNLFYDRIFLVAYFSLEFYEWNKKDLLPQQSLYRITVPDNSVYRDIHQDSKIPSVTTKTIEGWIASFPHVSIRDSEIIER